MTDHSPVRYRREGQIAFIDIDNPPVNALSAAVRQGLAAAMGEQRRVAVAGANGKTTTSSMLTSALLHLGARPSFALGGELAEQGTNAALGDGPGDYVRRD